MSPLQPHEDPVADILDEIAALAAYWKQNRDDGRMPPNIRRAMINTARDLLARVDMELYRG